MKRFFLIGSIILLFCAGAVSADPVTITVRADHPGIAISPTLYGLMTEEINHSYDGGLYAELIRNRSLQDDANAPAFWSVVKESATDAKISLDEKDPVNAGALSKSLRLDIAAAGGTAGIANDGYWGIPVWPNTRYTATFYAKGDPGISGPLTVAIQGNDGKTNFAKADLPPLTSQWKKYEVVLTTGDVPASADNRFVISTSGKGTAWFSMVSLFPPTYKNRLNGNRIDLMEKLADMHATFLRLPGGNYLEGNEIKERFNWANTLGELETRAGHQGPWGYRSSDGFGLAEFYGWCEDLNIQPVLAVFAGYSLRGAHINPGEELKPFVQEALDEIEYSIGSPTTKWGQVRANAGHPKPYNVQYVEIGNEDEFDRSRSYDGRFAQFYDAIKSKYPQLQLIATAKVKSRIPDVIDDHFYRSARSMEADFRHYDKAPRQGPKIFVGEWATEEGTPTPDLNAAVADAAWMMGMEKNSDLVVMSCYAPLLVNVNKGAWQWPTNLIGYNALTSFGSPSYYAQEMFYKNRGDVVLPVEIVQKPVDPALAPKPHGGIGVGTWQTAAEYKDLRVTSGNQVLYQSDFSEKAANWRARSGNWAVKDGAYQQSTYDRDCRATTGDTSWGDYTYELKARKTGGDEGFLVLFHVQGRQTYFFWNIAGWGNTRTSLQRVSDGNTEEFGPSTPMSVETNRWYDIRIELQGHEIKGFLDGKLVVDTIEKSVEPDGIIATASRANSTGDIIIKMVNTVPAVQEVQIKLEGAGSAPKEITGEIISGNPTDVNSLEKPTNVAPQPIKLQNSDGVLTQKLPGPSVTVIRLHG